jgi:S1-C subfamily serine protease
LRRQQASELDGRADDRRESAPGAAQPPDVFSRIPAIVRNVQPEVVPVLTGGGVGSGVIYRPNGVILTNDHVVHGASAVDIAFADGRRVRGKVMATDPDTDLALVKVGRENLPAATFQQKAARRGVADRRIGEPARVRQVGQRRHRLR